MAEPHREMKIGKSPPSPAPQKNLVYCWKIKFPLAITESAVELWGGLMGVITFEDPEGWA